MNPFQTVLIAVAEPGLATGLPPYPRMVARLLPDATIHIVHVIDSWRPAPTSERTHRDALNLLRQAARREFGKTRPVTCAVLHGDRLDSLLQYAVESSAGLILLGHRQTRYPKRTLARRLAMKAPCSIWMAPDGSPPRIRRVFAATDFSPAANQAVDAASLIAGRAVAGCLVFHVADSPAGSHDALVNNVPVIVDPGPTVAEAADRLTSAANGDLVVAGARGHSRASTVLLGRETDQLLLESKTPVLVVVPGPGGRVAIIESLLDRKFGNSERVA